ncbi:putative Outer membrane protein, OmpW family [Cupriavidus phytorum]|uniref:Outer membrane protein, OmpW family n=2 Tax=Cupriavidus TaxID=106589 RepID=A0A375B986_9BURK|nr:MULTISPECIES: OmpW family protein [Cupriavidus]PZX25509.1 outer membrane protein [Cupriavidus alkaliphilus]SOY40174.1 putative Outer membrane protein, OmpW family [Cupriavidus taiwanensis]
MKSTYKKMLAAGAVMALTGAAHAQSAGSNIVSMGWFRVMPNSSADPLTVDSIGGRPVGMTRPNTGAEIESADTLGLAFTHFFTDNISGEIVAGIPPKHDVKGTGNYAQYGKLGSVKQWSPALVVKYHFFDAKTKFRPYVGIGVNYTWFTDETITNQNFVNREFAPGARMTASAKPSWNPVFNIGATYAINDNWFVGLSVSYVPISTRASFTTQAGPVTIRSHTKIKIDPVVTYLNVGYRF